MIYTQGTQGAQPAGAPGKMPDPSHVEAQRIANKDLIPQIRTAAGGDIRNARGTVTVAFSWKNGEMTLSNPNFVKGSQR